MFSRWQAVERVFHVLELEDVRLEPMVFSFLIDLLSLLSFKTSIVNSSEL